MAVPPTGTDYDVEGGEELDALEKLIEDHGYYACRVEPGELSSWRRLAGSTRSSST